MDATYTNVATVNMGGFWQGSITPNQTAFFDNVTVTVNSVATHTITTGTVSLPPFLLANCGATATGSVDFTSTGTFNAPNIYTAQLSDDIGSFATPVTVGTLASTTNAGTINIVIPAGTPSGVGYKIRVDSNDPAVLGFESAAFSIIQSGTGGCASSHTDYYRSILTGDWADPSIWQSSPDNINWISATLSPTFLAKTINVRNSNTVTLTSTVIADEVVVDFNAILINNMAPVNALIINNGPGVDLDIQTGGVYQVISGNGYFLYQVVNGGATVHIANQGSILIGSGGPLAGSNQNGFAITSGTYIWDNGSIFDWNTTSIPGTSGLTFFPDAAATVSPVLRFTAAPATAIGGANPFVVNGILEPNTAVIFDGASNKTFRNGIHGTANVTMNAGAGQLIVDGQVASFRGAGTIIPNSLGLLIGRNAAAILAVLTTNKTVNGNIVFHPTATSAIINVGPHFLTVSGIVTNGSTTKYVQTNINGGALTLNNITTSKTFPIGETTYNPLIITTASGDNFTARVRTGIFDPSGAIPTDAVNRTWYINSSNAGNTPGVHVTYQYSDNPGELTGSAATQPTSMEVLQSDFTTWHLSPGNNAILSVGSNPYTVTTMAPLTINSTPIPYALGVTGTQFLALDFFITARAQKRNNNADINWNVMETANLLGFDVQRSANNGAYQTIGTVNPTAQLLHYTFTDTRVEAGVNLYRIRVNRAAGGLRYSNTVAIINGSKGLLITGLAPNPMHGHGLLTLSAAKQGMVNFELYNMNGALARQWRSPVNEGTNTLTFATGGLPGGIYQLIASADGVRTVFRIVIQ